MWQCEGNDMDLIGVQMQCSPLYLQSFVLLGPEI